MAKVQAARERARRKVEIHNCKERNAQMRAVGGFKRARISGMQAEGQIGRM